MTVANTTTKLQYKGNGENRTFGITFPLADGSHLRLFLTTPQGVESEITKNFAFSDTLDSITYPTLESGMEPLADGYTLTLLRQTPPTQELDLQSGHALDAEELERGFDKLTCLVQEAQEQMARAICYPVSAEEKTSAEGFLEQLNELKDTAQKAQAEAQKALSQASDLKDETLQIARCARNIAGADEDVPVDIAILLDEIKETQEN
jgi:hypothetical protein|nr:MAG TPA: tail fiber protein [Caudoviricetes sp.]DAN02658.1 MAG TPA: tail fiber protein [Caudoviricetes sp.]